MLCIALTCVNDGVMDFGVDSRVIIVLTQYSLILGDVTKK